MYMGVCKGFPHTRMMILDVRYDVWLMADGDNDDESGTRLRAGRKCVQVRRCEVSSRYARSSYHGREWRCGCRVVDS